MHFPTEPVAWMMKAVIIASVLLFALTVTSYANPAFDDEEYNQSYEDDINPDENFDVTEESNKTSSEW